MVSIAMFNNKGGVGKTTLTCNIAAYIAAKGRKVLVVDCDPQCNTTQLIMGQEFSIDLYYKKDKSFGTTTISNILQPIEDGEASINPNVKPIDRVENSFDVYLIPGDPKFSIIEDRLGAAWHSLKGGDTGGYRTTNWNSMLLKAIDGMFDIVFFDLGPSLGSINRSVLIGCDHFITPMGTDIFSILGIRNISEWISGWINTYYHGLTLNDVTKLNSFGVHTKLKIEKGYLGYTIQQYIAKTIKGVRRPTKAYEEIIKNVPIEINNSLGKFAQNLTADDLKMGDVPHLYSLIPLAQSNSSPLLKLNKSNGLVGSQFRQVEDYGKLLDVIVAKIFENLSKQTHDLA